MFLDDEPGLVAHAGGQLHSDGAAQRNGRTRHAARQGPASPATARRRGRLRRPALPRAGRPCCGRSRGSRCPAPQKPSSCMRRMRGCAAAHVPPRTVQVQQHGWRLARWPGAATRPCSFTSCPLLRRNLKSIHTSCMPSAAAWPPHQLRSLGWKIHLPLPVRPVRHNRPARPCPACRPGTAPAGCARAKARFQRVLSGAGGVYRGHVRHRCHGQCSGRVGPGDSHP